MSDTTFDGGFGAMLMPDHGEDWALAAVELAAQTSEWTKGQL